MLFLSHNLRLNLPCSHEGIAGFFDGFHMCDVSGGTDEGEVHYIFIHKPEQSGARQSQLQELNFIHKFAQIIHKLAQIILLPCCVEGFALWKSCGYFEIFNLIV
jgi:hypothetical protein